MRPREGELTPVCCDRRDRHVIPRRLEAVLDRDLVRAGRVVRGKFPTAGPQLDERQAPQDLRRRRLVSLDRRSILALEKATGHIDLFHLEPVDGYG